MKVNVSLDDELMKRIDNYADENYMSRSGFISIACTQFLNTQDALKAVKEMAFCMRKIADAGKLDHETMEQLEDFERMCKLLMGVS